MIYNEIANSQSRYLKAYFSTILLWFINDLSIIKDVF